jgi:hypothetical protein
MCGVNRKPVEINYEGRRFTRSDIPTAPVAQWRQKGKIVFGDFSGADILHGTLCGRILEDGIVHFGYCMITTDNNLIVGECRSLASLDAEGLVQLDEEWTRLYPKHETGLSKLKEIRGD